MLRVAVPNKGSLAETAAQMLAEAGYAGRRDPKELYVLDGRNDVEFFYLRPRDIATYVGSGALDVGITGRDLLIDSASDARETAELGFAGSTFRFAGPVGRFADLQDLAGVRIATSYPVLVGGFLREHGVEAQLIRLDGAVESAIQLGVADAIADVVETGTTLRKAGLEIFGPVILRSTAVLISGAEEKPGAATLLRRLEGVLVARRYVLMDYDVPLDLLDAATAITPGIESPTISPLQDPAWVAVRSMVPRDDTNQIMDRLHEVGARAILVSPIHAARI
ncbi:ATP phosphoribosyltransferase [Clavibacter michiganensis]|uniref:ATP phosphoribosyltransferase n=1 Tax=Clavibacter michiganensis subsp. insidiosus TaxID=33014 RepID=A0A0D5CMI5_9MICO|nr:ATP phosphoribosyltransferase [Clavibacter michiganensis]AJW80475.1 ATP phosphoribosyltransferase [Clavibacter michiganensis subsp. insidiosus]OQJ61291.1 ATP phosphoribosyltransferase [Clavibacter michiganensis subsp. insidiosus]RII86689.1 ATP phosphoribosyltransferase [Clavibacter michiganensis subsp. insidiosus]RIJ33385.1 ATP phosphoribosyltransferase [Clavibacter michiganensis subsp. insidiosus]RMC89016.1 ATP phosphoribosyltransferase [Clavibacter michiganensis subsp. insidiosus]